MAYGIVGIDVTIWYVPDMASEPGFDDYLHEPTRPPQSCRH